MRHYVQLHLLVLLIATTAILGKLITLPAAGLVMWRTALAAIGAALWVALIRRKSVWPGKRMAATLVGIGLIVGVHWVSFFAAIKLANISICLAGLATVSLFTAFTEPLIEKRRVRPFEVLLGLLVLVGIALVAGFERGRLLGLAVAMLSALLAAIFPVLNRKLVMTGGDPLTMVAWEMVGACTAALALLPLFSDDQPILAWQGLDWLWILLLAWVCTVFAHAFHIHLLRHISAYTMNLALNFEPVYGILAAALLFHEHKQVTPFFYLGMGTILVANLAHVLVMRRVIARA
ncbi:DMT family transporter [Luteolibacter sp. GHJ8]|uniref:DMT family transporter n=1 Tax=Luteolibacter rhizosphaerae TaxID=2989719 RepID=A0ABT3G5R9_9BACT|nr:DMT family transporter [Luteolibacter rhizosphaerae]MCW1915168.1 DMT family transporter [Luteolibacter rhizosphaerae]